MILSFSEGHSLSFQAHASWYFTNSPKALHLKELQGASILFPLQDYFIPYSRLEWPSQMLDWPALLGCLELADMADIGWVVKEPSF